MVSIEIKFPSEYAFKVKYALDKLSKEEYIKCNEKRRTEIFFARTELNRYHQIFAQYSNNAYTVILTLDEMNRLHKALGSVKVT